MPQGHHLGKPPIALTRPVIVIGSRDNCRIHLNSSSVSKAHALLVKSGGTYYIRDLVSRTHVFVDGQRVREHSLRDGELIKIGSFILKFVAPAGVDLPEEEAGDVSPILPASLVPTSGEIPVPIDDRALLIGRRPGSQITLLEESASSSHAVVFEMDGKHYVRDLGSRTGTFVNRVKIHQHCLLEDDVIRVGETTLRYKPSADTATSEAPARDAVEIAAVVEKEVAPPIARQTKVEPAVVVEPQVEEVAKPEAQQPIVHEHADDFGLELLPASHDAAPPVEAEAIDLAVHPVEPPASTAADETPPQILPGRRGWRGAVSEEGGEGAGEKPESTEHGLLGLTPAEVSEGEDLLADLPLAPDVSSVPDALVEDHTAEEPIPLLPVDDGALDLSNLAGEHGPAVHEVDFDEDRLVNQHGGSSDVIDFALDLEPSEPAEPLFSVAGVAEIAAAEKAEAQRREAERLAQARAEEERAEAQRLAAEQARIEAERVAAQQAEAQRIEAERIAAEKAEAQRIEAERVAAERAAAQRVEAERIAAERAAAERAEAERIAAERAEAERLEVERILSEKAEAERVAAAIAQAEQIEAERAAAEAARQEAERLAAEQAEAERLEAERVAAEKAEAERIAAAQAEAARIEAERLAAEKAEAERVAAEQAEAARIEAERIVAEKAEAERIAAEEAEAARIEAERLAAEKAEAERAAAEQAEAARIEAERIVAEKVEAERIAAEEAQAARIEAERAAAAKAEQERLEAERLEAERLAAEKAEADRIVAQQAEAARVEAERIAAEKAEAERLEAERFAAAKAEAERIEAERLAAEKAAAERIAAEQAEAARIEAERIAAEKAEAQRIEAERAEAQRIESERLAEEAEAALGRIEAERLESEQADADRLLEEEIASEETLDVTEPTPESAFELETIEDEPADTTSGGSATTALSYFDAPASLSDSSFGRALDDFTGDLTGELVEPFTEAAVEPEIPAAATPESSTLDSIHVEAAQTPLLETATSETELSDAAFEELFLSDLPATDSAPIDTQTIETIASEALPASSESTQADLDIFDEFVEPSADELDLSKLVEADQAPAAQTPFDAADHADDWEPLPTDETAQPAPPVAEAPTKPLFPIGETRVGGAFQPWGGNQFNWLGGQAVDLSSPAPLPPPAPVPPMARPGARLEPAEPPPVAPPHFAAQSPAAPPSKAAEDEEIESVSAMIGEILVGEARPNVNVRTPFSQGVSPLPPAPSIEQIASTPLPVPPPRTPRRALRRGIAELVQEKKQAALRIDEQIPPFGTPLPDLAAQGRRKSVEGEALDSLAKPPVQETDVFAHTSPPSSEETVEEMVSPDDPLSPMPRANPMLGAPAADLVFNEASGSRHLSRRVRGGMRLPPLAGAAGASSTSRVNLPNDPFWSGAPGAGSGAGNGGGAELPPLAAAVAANFPPGGGRPARAITIPKAFRPPTKQVRSRMPEFAYAAEEDHSAALAQRRRRLRQVPLLMLLGAVLIVADVLGIWKLLPPRSTIEAQIHFAHLADASENDRKSFINEQASRRLSEPDTRHLAIVALSKQNPELAPGFLDNPVEFTSVGASASWPGDNRDVLSLSRSSTDPEGDIQRMKAVGVAVYEANSVHTDIAQQAQDTLAEAQADIESNRKTLEDLQRQIDEKENEYLLGPSVETIAGLKADRDRLQKAWDASIVAQKGAEADLARLQGTSVDSDTTQPSASPASDDQARQLQTQLDAINAQLAQAKAARLKQAQDARAALDASIAQFEQQVADAKAITKDNPQLTSYIAAAQKFQETTRALVDDLMRRQQQQYAQLTDLQARLNDRMQARREQMWQQDAQLQKMNDQLGYAQRQYNTAIGTGQQKEADDHKAEIELLETTIKARQDLIPADPMYADVVDQLQKLVDQQQKSMQEDRQTTAKALDDAQQSFAQSQPTVDQLPAQQQTLAADMQKRLAEINAARAKYSDAAGAVGDGSDETTRKLKEQAASLAASIDLHSKQVADASQSAQRQQEIQEKLAQVASLTQAAKTAEDAYNVKVSDLERAQAAQKAAYAASAEHDALIVRKTPIEKQQDQLLADLSIKQDAVKNSIAPVMITDADIHRATVVDNRMKCAAVTSIPIFLIFSGLILMTIHAASRELPLNALSPSDDGPEPFSLPSYPPNGEPNGAHANGNGSHDEDPNGHSDIEPDVDAEATALNSLSASGDEMDEQDPESQPADAIVQN